MSAQYSNFPIVFAQIINSCCFFSDFEKKKEVKHLNASKTNFVACHPQTFINKHKKKKSGYCFSKN